MLSSRSTVLLLLFSGFLFLSACGKDTPAEPEPEVEQPPTFSISTKTVVLQSGEAGLQFFATPSDDVVLVRVEISNPVGEKLIFNAGSITVVKGQVTPIQDPNLAYVKISGTWTLKFVGSRAVGSKSSFDVTTTVNVGA